MSRRIQTQPILALLFDKGDQAKRFLEEKLTINSVAGELNSAPFLRQN